MIDLTEDQMLGMARIAGLHIPEAFIASLNVAVMTATPVAPLAGLVELTVGATVSPGDVGLSSSPHPAATARSSANGSAMKLLFR